MFEKEKAKKVIVKKTKSGSSYNTYVFECSDCGADINVQVGSFKTHSGKCRRCCQKIRPYEHILNELKYRCNTKTFLDFTLTYEEFITIIEAKECHYCGKELTFSTHTRDKDGNYTSRAYQLDRKNNDLGYTKENVVLCCWDCNRIKSDIYNYEEFLLIAEVLREINSNRNANI